MSASALGVGVAGTGAGVRTHIPVLSVTDGARVTAVWSHSAERARAVAEQFGIPHPVADLDELAGLDDVDLVVVATTPDLHYPAVMAATRAGKHVLCEKPFALDAAQAAGMWEAAHSAGVRHFVNHEFRVEPATIEMRRRLQAGDIGRVTYVAFSDFGDFVTTTQSILSRWWFEEARGGGWLGAHGSHRIDQLRFLFGEITEVSSLLETVVAAPERKKGSLVSEVDDTYLLTLRFASGAVGVCLDGAATTVPVRPERLEVYGTEGTLVMEGDRLWAARPGGSLGEVELDRPAAPGLDSRGDVLHWLFYRRILEAIESGNPLRPDFEDGLREQEVVDAARRADAERRWVRVGEPSS